MSDDLVKRLYDRRVCSPAQNSCRNDLVLDQAAERIEELEAERDDYANKLMEAGNNYTEMHLHIEQLEAKLAKAVEALRGLVPILCEGIEDGCGKLSRHDCAACEGYATIAELSSVSCANLKGQDDE